MFIASPGLNPFTVSTFNKCHDVHSIRFCGLAASICARQFQRRPPAYSHAATHYLQHLRSDATPSAFGLDKIAVEQVVHVEIVAARRQQKAARRRQIKLQPLIRFYTASRSDRTACIGSADPNTRRCVIFARATQQIVSVWREAQLCDAADVTPSARVQWRHYLSQRSSNRSDRAAVRADRRSARSAAGETQSTRADPARRADTTFDETYAPHAAARSATRHRTCTANSQSRQRADRRWARTRTTPPPPARRRRRAPHRTLATCAYRRPTAAADGRATRSQSSAPRRPSTETTPHRKSTRQGRIVASCLSCRRHCIARGAPSDPRWSSAAVCRRAQTPPT
jgi:hypothetical protein